MITVEKAVEIIDKIKILKTVLIKAQDYENAALLRDMEKKYLDKKTK